MSEIEPLNEELSNKVFNNPIILQIIVSRTRFFCDDLQLRLVNKLFNYVVLNLNRITFGRQNFEFMEETDGVRGLTNEWVYTHWRWTKITHLPKLFNFLSDVVKVKVDEIRIKNVWKLKSEVAKEFHDSIHKILIGNNRKSVRTLVGLEEVCNGCEDCLDIAQNSKVYGPIGFEIISKIQHHFDELIITDRLLEQIANNCVQDSVSYEDCHKKLETIINNSSISCDTLSLRISETRRINGQRVLDQFKMPREILDKMIEKWNVNSMKLSFHRSFQDDVPEDVWCETDYFTGFRFNDPFLTVEKKVSKNERKIQKVTVDLYDSCAFQHDFRWFFPPNQAIYGYDNTIANIRRIFKTDRIDIKCLSHIFHKIEQIHTILTNLIRFAKFDDPTNLTINVDFFHQITCWRWFPEPVNSLIIPKEYSIQSDKFTLIHREMTSNIDDLCKDFMIYQWHGRRFKVDDDTINFKINLNYFVNSGCLKRKISKKLSNVVPFLKYFNFN